MLVLLILIMIIAISGLHGTGKSTVAKKIAEDLGLEFYSTGNMFRELAVDKGITIEELSIMAENDKKIDFELDDKVKAYALKNNCVLDNQSVRYFKYCLILPDRIVFIIKTL